MLRRRRCFENSQNRREAQVAEKECRRCSISGLLMLIWWALMGHLLGASCGYRKTFGGPRSGSRSLRIRPNSVRPPVHPYVRIFFSSRFWSNEMELRSKKREKRRLKKRYCVSRVIESVKLGPGSNYSLVETAFRKRVVVVAGTGK